MERAYQKTPVDQQPSEERPLQLTLDRRRVFAEMQEGLHQFGVKLGLELTAELMKEEVERFCERDTCARPNAERRDTDRNQEW